MPTLGDYLLVSGLLFSIGLAGVLLRRNLLDRKSVV
jgi:NADH:ubiquinone oxidoreductase subunit K